MSHSALGGLEARGACVGAGFWHRRRLLESEVMLRNLAWTLQVVALVIVGTALLVGLVYDEIRTEVGMLAVGGALFLFGRWLDNRAAE